VSLASSRRAPWACDQSALASRACLGAPPPRGASRAEPDTAKGRGPVMVCTGAIMPVLDSAAVSPSWNTPPQPLTL
jgi:hypothetical protein